MRFKDNSVEEIKNLSNNEDYFYFFDNMKKDTDEKTNQLIEKLALILANELNTGLNDLDKIEFFIKLGFFAKK